MIFLTNNKVYTINSETIYKWSRTETEIREFSDRIHTKIQELQMKMFSGQITPHEYEEQYDSTEYDKFVLEITRMVFTSLYKTMGKEDFDNSFLISSDPREAGTLIHGDDDRSGINLDTGEYIVCEVCMAKMQERLKNQRKNGTT